MLLACAMKRSSVLERPGVPRVREPTGQCGVCRGSLLPATCAVQHFRVGAGDRCRSAGLRLRGMFSQVVSRVPRVAAAAAATVAAGAGCWSAKEASAENDSGGHARPPRRPLGSTWPSSTSDSKVTSKSRQGVRQGACGGAGDAVATRWAASPLATSSAPCRSGEPDGSGGPATHTGHAKAAAAGDEKAADLPVYTREEVAEHNGRRGDGSMWVTLGHYVYDVTSFVDEHPGGPARIREAAGGAVDDFWAVWAYHLISPKVPGFLAKLRIGRLRAEEGDDGDHLAATMEALWADEPRRPPTQEPLSVRPFSSQTTRSAMARSYLTPNADFYVRNHTPVPVLAGDAHKVNVHGKVVSVEALRSRFEQARIVATMQCSGNRGGENIEVGGPTPFSGTPYASIDVGMMGNALWEGPRVRDVLLELVPWLRDTSPQDWCKMHCIFEGADGYETSTRLDRVMDPTCDAIFAVRMNGEPLPPDHGAPLRVLLPGITGARNVKWVTSVRVSREESDSCWTTTYYKNKDGGTPETIQEVPMQSLILWPRPDISVEGYRPVTVRGVAWSGASGAKVTKVEVSTDRGATWQEARLNHAEVPENDGSRSWGWVRWECDARLPAAGSPAIGGRSKVTLLCRATDERGNVQEAARFRPGGYLYAGWHRVVVDVPWLRDGHAVPLK